MRLCKYAIILGGLIALAGGVQAVPRGVVAAKPRAVVELFTSPFCSSCPPADELFVELARHPDLITLVMPVDSWDRPGRKDALAKPAFTDRQAAYAEVRNEDTLYTPEAIINGAAPAQGSDQGEIEDAIRQTAGVLSVPVKAAAVGQEIVVTVGAVRRAAEGGAVITVLPFMAAWEIPMRGGETLRYANLVRDVIPVGTWSGQPVKERLSRSAFGPYDGIVVLVQAGTRERPGAILGATRLTLAPASAMPRAKRVEWLSPPRGTTQALR
jgi:hypothetical protein